MGKQKNQLQEQVFEFVETHINLNGYPPTYDEIRKAIGLSSKSHVDYYLQALEEDGLIERTPRTPRGLRLVGLAPSTFDVQVEGTIAAGQPIELADGYGESITLSPDIADPRKDLFALRVEGDSMIEDLVGDGDLIITQRQTEARRGQMAIVHLRERNEATLKHVYPEGSRVRLQPAHPTMPAFYAAAQNVRVQGKVVAIIRQP